MRRPPNIARFAFLVHITANAWQVGQSCQYVSEPQHSGALQDSSRRSSEWAYLSDPPDLGGSGEELPQMRMAPDCLVGCVCRGTSSIAAIPQATRSEQARMGEGEHCGICTSPDDCYAGDYPDIQTRGKGSRIRTRGIPRWPGQENSICRPSPSVFYVNHHKIGRAPRPLKSRPSLC